MSRLGDDCIKVPINGYINDIQTVMKELTKLTKEEIEKYDVDSATLSSAQNTLRRIELYRGYDKALMNAGDADDIIYALVGAYYVEMKKHTETLKKHIELIEKYNKLCDDIDEYNKSVVGPLCHGAAIFCREQGMDVPKKECIENGKKMIAFSYKETAKVMNAFIDSMKNRTDLTASTLYRKANESPSIKTWKEFIDYYEANTDLHDEESEYYKKYPMADWKCSLLKDYYKEAKRQLAKLQHTENVFVDETTEEEVNQLLADCGVPFLPDGTPIGIGD